MAQSAEHFVGRTDELGVLSGLVAGLDRGIPGALGLTGEPGIGKSRLLSELATLAEARGHLVLEGGASEPERDVPLWVFADALDEYLHGLEESRLEALAHESLSELASVFPSLAHMGNGHVATLQNERYRTHRAVRELLEVLASTRPLVFLLDDLQWADAPSVELLCPVRLPPPGAAVLIAMGVRRRQVPDRLGA